MATTILHSLGRTATALGVNVQDVRRIASETPPIEFAFEIDGVPYVDQRGMNLLRERIAAAAPKTKQESIQ